MLESKSKFKLKSKLEFAKLILKTRVETYRLEEKIWKTVFKRGNLFRIEQGKSEVILEEEFSGKWSERTMETIKDLWIQILNSKIAPKKVLKS